MYCNEKLIDDYSMESPMQLVLDGKWTLDKFLTMAQDISNDLDGNGV